MRNVNPLLLTFVYFYTFHKNLIIFYKNYTFYVKLYYICTIKNDM